MRSLSSFFCFLFSCLLSCFLFLNCRHIFFWLNMLVSSCNRSSALMTFSRITALSGSCLRMMIDPYRRSTLMTFSAETPSSTKRTLNIGNVPFPPKKSTSSSFSSTFTSSRFSFLMFVNLGSGDRISSGVDKMFSVWIRSRVSLISALLVSFRIMNIRFFNAAFCVFETFWACFKNAKASASTWKKILRNGWWSLRVAAFLCSNSKVTR